jgi:cytochrome c peroxidase
VPPGAWLATTPQPTPAELERRRLEFCRTTLDDKLAYKARPLYGVWATAPFLHNGSVPTLYDLLLPADARPKHFLQGTREYDPVMVGFVTQPRPDNTSRFDVVDNLGAPIVGNSNAGHDYGNAQFTPKTAGRLSLT